MRPTARAPAVGVIAPLRAEAATAAALERAGWRVVRSGTGPERARRATERLLAAGCTRLLVWGCAGGLDPALAPGALLLADAVVAPDLRRDALDPEWRRTLAARLPAGLAAQAGAIASVAAPVAAAAAKRALRERTGAAAVDMEAAAVAAVCRARDVPCAVLRAVADPAERALPALVVAAAGARFVAPHIVGGLVRRPRELSAVAGLARDFGRARRSLAAVARALSAAASF